MEEKFEPLISVIIPVYNVEKYLRECLDSVINQTYKNLEIICVNDCSSDCSLEILESYTIKDERIKIINNKTNLGVGITRNIGFNASNGKYIHFFDSDDWLELTAYQILVDILKNNNNIDIIKFNYCNHNVKTGINVISTPDEFLNKSLNIQNCNKLIKAWHPSIWLKLMNKNFLLDNNIFFNEFRCYEDLEYSIDSLIKAKNIYCINNPLVHYREFRKNSLISNRDVYLEEMILSFKKIIAKIENIPLYRYIYVYVYYHFMRALLYNYYKNTISFKELRAYMQKYISCEILSDFSALSYYYLIYNKIMTYNSLQFRFAYCLREFFKENFPKTVELYFKIKKLNFIF